MVSVSMPPPVGLESVSGSPMVDVEGDQTKVERSNQEGHEEDGGRRSGGGGRGVVSSVVDSLIS